MVTFLYFSYRLSIILLLWSYQCCVLAVTTSNGENVLDLKGNSTRRDLASEHQKIIGGEEVMAGQYPWFAYATKYNFEQWYACGGMLVAPEFVLTAAHCIYNDFLSHGGYIIGSLCAPFTKKKNCGQIPVERLKVKKAYVFPQYKYDLNNDFALVQLQGSSTIKPVNIDKGEYSPKYDVGKSLLAIGFGDKNADDNIQNFPSRLRDVEVNYISNQECQNRYNSIEEVVTSSMMCAAADGKDSCQGDSGGPLYDKENDVVVGVVSWGMGCADPLYPGVYSRIATQWEWIKRTICKYHTPTTAPEFCTTLLGEEPSQFKLIVKADSQSKIENKWIINEKRNNTDTFELLLEKKVKEKYRTTKLTLDGSSCFQFSMYDSSGDGFTSGQPPGYYSIAWKGKKLKNKSDMSGKFEEHTMFGSC